jgi:transcription elongation factor Elf1
MVSNLLILSTTGISSMTDVDSNEIEFQCPCCGHDLKQTIGQLKAEKHMICPGCGIGMNIDTNRLANAVEEIRRAIEKSPPEITVKFFR